MSNIEELTHLSHSHELTLMGKVSRQWCSDSEARDENAMRNI
jgi:hypothetical protein